MHCVMQSTFLYGRTDSSRSRNDDRNAQSARDCAGDTANYSRNYFCPTRGKLGRERKNISRVQKTQGEINLRFSRDALEYRDDCAIYGRRVGRQRWRVSPCSRRDLMKTPHRAEYSPECARKDIPRMNTSRWYVASTSGNLTTPTSASPCKRMNKRERVFACPYNGKILFSLRICASVLCDDDESRNWMNRESDDIRM